MIGTDKLMTMSVDDLRAELKNALDLTVEQLFYAAAIWRELERKENDLSDLRGGIYTYLALIASGAVLPEVVARFFGKTAVCRAIASLPVEHQTAVLKDGSVPLAVDTGTGYAERRIPLSAVTPSQVRVIFGDRQVRTIAEQIAMLTRPAPVYTPGKPTRSGRIKVDTKNGTFSIGRTVEPLESVLTALRRAGINKLN